MSKDNYHRFPGDEKVKGVDYQFYRELLAGQYDAEAYGEGLDGLDYQADTQSYEDALVKA